MKALFPAYFLFFAIIFFYGTGHAFDVMLDPGHSPSQGGAISCTGQKEYIYNDKLAALIREKLASSGINVEMTRTPAQNRSLKERAALARGRDLFLAVHHDSVQPQFLDKGAVYPTSTKARGFSLFVSRKNKYFNESLAYAKSIGRQLRMAGFRPTMHHAEPIKGENRTLLDRENGIYEFNDLVVLKHADAPAVLLEAGVIVHPDEEKRLSGPYRAKIANAVDRALAGNASRR